MSTRNRSKLLRNRLDFSQFVPSESLMPLCTSKKRQRKNGKVSESLSFCKDNRKELDPCKDEKLDPCKDEIEQSLTHECKELLVSNGAVDNRMKHCHSLIKTLNHRTTGRAQSVRSSTNQIKSKAEIDEQIISSTETNVMEKNDNHCTGAGRKHRMSLVGRGKECMNYFETVQIGSYELFAPYFSPYPADFCAGVDKLFICEKCFGYSCSKRTSERHSVKCALKSEDIVRPGWLIYNDKEKAFVVRVVDGAVHKEYCQNLCLFCKLYLDHKTLAYDVDSFHFYVLAVGGTVVGYFSKEKDNHVNNLSCILTFPQYQGKGYGRFLISLSYELSRAEGKICNPEKPLSEHGLAAYRSYWRGALIRRLLQIADKSNKENDLNSLDNNAVNLSLWSQKLNGADGTICGKECIESDFHDSTPCFFLNEPIKLERSGKKRQIPSTKPFSPNRVRGHSGVGYRPFGNGGFDTPENEMECDINEPQFVDLKRLSNDLGIDVMDLVDVMGHNHMLLKRDGHGIIYLSRGLLAKYFKLEAASEACNPLFLSLYQNE